MQSKTIKVAQPFLTAGTSSFSGLREVSAVRELEYTIPDVDDDQSAVEETILQPSSAALRDDQILDELLKSSDEETDHLVLGAVTSEYPSKSMFPPRFHRFRDTTLQILRVALLYVPV